jgi:hypothetical protein
LREDHALQRALRRRPLLFVVEEEERLVLQDRAALRNALLIVAQLVFRGLARRRVGWKIAVAEPRVGVERVAPQVLIGRAGPVVRPDFVTNLICTPPWPVESAVLPAVVTVTSSTESSVGLRRAK